MKPNISLLAVLTVVAAHVATAQITYNGGTYSENFNLIFSTDGTGTAPIGSGLGTHFTITTLPTWQVTRIAGTTTGNFALFADWGGSAASPTARLYSYGLPASTERALGALGSGGSIFGFGTWFVNNSAETYTKVTFTFEREIWRTQSSPIDQSLAFSYGLASSGIGTGNFITNNLMTAFAPLNATAPAFYASLYTGTNWFTDPGTNMVVVSATIYDLNWAPGDSLFIRWNDSNDTGNDAGIAIDNLSMIASVPEPSSSLTLLWGGATLALLRRRSHRRDKDPAPMGMEPPKRFPGCVAASGRKRAAGFPAET